MSNDLHDRLAEVADRAAYDAPPATTPGELWERGVRRQRERRALASAAVAAVVAGVVGLGAVVSSALSEDRTPPPATPVPLGDAVLPDRIATPPAWMPGTDDVGLPGRLSAVVSGERRGWPVAERALAGVSAADGSMAWLDLPDDAVPDTGASSGFDRLSPDGRRVVFWTTGETAGTPADREEPQVTGVAVWDAASGAVVRQEFPTEHGLMPQSLGWADDTTVVLRWGDIRGGYGELVQSSSATVEPVLRWRPGEGDPQPVTAPRRLDDVVTAGDGRLVWSTSASSRAVRVTDLTGTPLTGLVPSRGVMMGSLAFSPSLERVADLPGSRNPTRLAVAPVRRAVADGTAAFRRVGGGARTSGVLRWTDEDTVAVRRHVDGDGASALVLHDVDSGRATEVLRYPTWTGGSTTDLAAGLLTAEVVDAPAPDDGTDPRVVAGVGAAVLLAGLVLGRARWRRRVRA